MPPASALVSARTSSSLPWKPRVCVRSHDPSRRGTPEINLGSFTALAGTDHQRNRRTPLHRADGVENVIVLIACRDQLPKQAELPARLSPHLLCLWESGSVARRSVNRR